MRQPLPNLFSRILSLKGEETYGGISFSRTLIEGNKAREKIGAFFSRKRNPSAAKEKNSLIKLTMSRDTMKILEEEILIVVLYIFTYIMNPIAS